MQGIALYSRPNVGAPPPPPFSGAEDGVVCAIACARPLAEGGSLGGGSWGADAAELCSMLPGGVQVGGLYCGEAMAGELQKGLMALRKHTPHADLVGAVVFFDPEPAAKLAVLSTGVATLPPPSPSPPSEEDPIAERLLVRLTAQVSPRFTPAPPPPHLRPTPSRSRTSLLFALAVPSCLPPLHTPSLPPTRASSAGK